jgi:ribonuclease BN (tRNA processing enzyme)
MKIRILGCSGAIAHQARTTAFLVDERILVDAGTGVGDLSLDEMSRIDHVLLTHSHLDHVAALPLMLDSVAARRDRPVMVYALPETIAALRQHIFNDQIWPDFTVIPTPERPFLTFQAISVGEVLEIGGHRAEVLPAEHSVPAVGYAVDTPAGYWVFTGDTERNPAFWERINQMYVAMLVIETAFSQRESELAHRSRHLCPSVLGEELAQLQVPIDRPITIGITHTKPSETDLIRSEMEALGLANQYPLVWLESGQVFDF